MREFYITDLNGEKIKVTDLEKALAEADEYRHYRHTNKKYKVFDESRQAYWQDLYEKLKELKNKLL
jgi:hypothetical protein